MKLTPQEKLDRLRNPSLPTSVPPPVPSSSPTQVRSANQGNRAFQDLIVGGLGFATSVATAMALVYIENQFGVAVYSWSLWIVVPVGAILAGLIASTGYYAGARWFHHRPNSLFLVNVIVISLSTYVMLNWMQYTTLDVDGVPASEILSFGEYLDTSIQATSITSYRHGRQTGNTGTLGLWGYALAGLDVIGFAVGGFLVYAALDASAYCETCCRYLKRDSHMVRYTSDATALDVQWGRLLALLAQGRSEEMVSQVIVFGQAKSAKMKYKISLARLKCTSCTLEHLEGLVFVSEGKWQKEWHAVPELGFKQLIFKNVGPVNDAA